jgi:radical SAM superfamily enzyme YgiQ (UPF0313 family)
MKILFAFYPLFIKWNHGIGLLSAICKKAGIDVSLHVLSTLVEFEKCLENYDGQFVGFSAVCSEDYRQSLDYMRLAKIAKKTVLFGGTWAGWNIEVDSSADYVCRGGAETLVEFLLNGNDDLFKRNIPDDFDNLPFPDYEIFKTLEFDRGIPCLKNKKVLPYVSSKGCPYKCSFCQIQHQPKGVKIRRKMAEELSILKNQYGAEAFWLGDSTLPYYDEKWRESWENFKHPFACYIRADIKPDQLEWLIERGMIGCGFGVESGDEKFRNDVLKKQLTDEELFRTVKILKKHNIEYLPFFMTGLSGETFLMRAKTAKMAREIGEYSIIWHYAPEGQVFLKHI